MFFSLLAMSHVIAIEALDYDMLPQDKKKTGIYKLSDKEKGALQKWIDMHYEKRETPALGEGEEMHAQLQENLSNGRSIRLSNGTLWNIHPGDTLISQGWITPVDIIVTQSGDPDYPYKLTNSVTGSSVRAKKAEKKTLPPAPPAQPKKP